MKRLPTSTQIQFIVLTLGVIVLLIDAFSHYRAQFSTYHLSSTQQQESPLQAINNQPPKVVVASPSAQPQSKYKVISFQKIRSIDATQIEAAEHSFIRATPSALVSQVSIYQLQYEILGRNGMWKPVSAKAYLPATHGKYPLFVFGSGTTGMADKCAPSLENVAVENLGNYDNQMIAQTAAGFVSVFPDYEGFHSSDETQAYFVSESEARTLLGAIQSLIELQPNTPALSVADTEAVFLSGYSQGGHAALSAALQWNTLPPSVKLKGIVQYAGAADVQALFKESPWLASYLIDSYVQYYGLPLRAQDALQDKWLIEMNRNNEVLCVNQAYKYYPHDPSKVYSPAFLDAIETHTWPDNLKPWNKVIQANIPLSNLPDVPYLSIQGSSDPIVTAKTQVANVEKMCQEHKQVIYREYSGVNHFQIRQVSFMYSNEWMNTVLSGGTLKSSCQ
jgi:predicted esterase